jgi:hypothetical protein
MTTLDSPCATVSWMSPANRCRSSAMPASRDRRATSARVESNSTISAARSSLMSSMRWIVRAIATEIAVTITPIGTVTVRLAGPSARRPTTAGANAYATTTAWAARVGTVM